MLADPGRRSFSPSTTRRREAKPDDNDSGANLLQCRELKEDRSHTGDLCPRDGGLDQNIYGDLTP